MATKFDHRTATALKVTELMREAARAINDSAALLIIDALEDAISANDAEKRRELIRQLDEHTRNARFTNGL